LPDDNTIRQRSGDFYAAVFERAGNVPPSEGKNAKEIADLLRVLIAKTRFSLLDIACGIGAVVRLARELFPNGTFAGTDISPSIVAKAAGLDAAIAYEAADELNLPYHDASFDYATCRQSIHHFPRMIDHLHEVKRILTPDGAYLIMDIVPDEGEQDVWFNELFLSAEHEAEGDGHVKFYTLTEYRSLCDHAGFSLTRVKSYEHAATWPKGRPYFDSILSGIRRSPLSFQKAIAFAELDDRYVFTMPAAGMVARVV